MGNSQSEAKGSKPKKAEKAPQSPPPKEVKQDEFEEESGDEAAPAEQSNMHEEAGFFDILRGPVEILPLPCHLCGIKMRVRRWRCWECNINMCGKCRRADDNPHAGHLLSRDQVENLQPARGATVRDVFKNAFESFAPRPLFGVIRHPSLIASSFPSCQDIWTWYSYEHIYSRARAFGTGLKTLVPEGRYVGICGENGIEWILTDLAGWFQGIVTVPVNPLFHQDQVNGIASNTELVGVICSADLAPKFKAAAAKFGLLEFIILMEEIGGEVKERKEDKDSKVNVLRFREVEEKGREILKKHPKRSFSVKVAKPDDLATIGYTGGSTGAPKGCMLAERRWNKRLSSFFLSSIPILLFCYEPLTHFNGRNQILEGIAQGARIVLYQPSRAPQASLCSSPTAQLPSVAAALNALSPYTLRLLATLPHTHDCSKILTSIALVQPLRVFCLPMIWNLLYKQYQQTFKEALALEHDLTPDREAKIKTEIISAFRALFGRRLNSASSGSAAISPLVFGWMKEVFDGIIVNDAYGSTETGGICNEGRPIVPEVEVKLRDVPELGYLTSDRPPRGEILVKTDRVALGYFKMPEESKQKFLADGWYASGDIGILEEDKDGTKVTIIDRATSLFKVSTGEYLCPEKLESVWLESKYVRQCYVLGDASLDYVVAIIVPEPKNIPARFREIKEEALTYGMGLGLSPVVVESLDEKAESSKVPDVSFGALVLEDLVSLSKKARLLDFETPRVVHIDFQPFTVENKRLTPILKMNRPLLYNQYQPILQQLRATGKTRDKP